MAFAKQLSKKYRLIYLARSFFAWMLLFYLQFWSHIALTFFNGTIIGIAGAVGKSTTKNALYGILSVHKKTIAIEGNSETGIPLGILGLSSGSYSFLDWAAACFFAPFHILHVKKYEYLIVEMGIDGPKAPKNMNYLLRIIQPHIGILLSESPAHIEHYEEILPDALKHTTPADQLTWFSQYQLEDDAAMLMTNTIQTSILDASEPSVYRYVKNHTNHALFTVGEESEHDIQIHGYEISQLGTQFGFSIHTHQMKEYVTVMFPSIALPKQSGASIGCAILTALHLGIPLDAVKQSLEQSFTLPPGRGTIFPGIKSTIIIDSSYNVSPASMISFLKLAKDLKRSTKKPIVCIMGDMKELGSYTEYSHKEIAKEFIGTVDTVILVGHFTKQCMLPYIEQYKHKFQTIISLKTIKQLNDYLSQIPQEGIILVKGSQTLEEGIKLLLKNPKDAAKLCRQDEFWIKNKKERNVWIDSN